MDPGRGPQARPGRRHGRGRRVCERGQHAGAGSSRPICCGITSSSPVRRRGRSGRCLTVIPLVFEANFRGHGAMEAWTINGKSYPDARSRRCSGAGATACSSSTGAAMIIRCICTGTALRDSVHRSPLTMRRPRTSTASSKTWCWSTRRPKPRSSSPPTTPALTLFHCHQQNHMDLGFMMLFDYA